MKTIKIIDLLNKIANGEEVPKKIKYASVIYEYDDDNKDYTDGDIWLFYHHNNLYLNEKVVILDEDEFEDIEGLNIFTDPNTIDNSEFVWRINYLIENQKKIIDKLNKE